MRISPCDRTMTKYWYNDYVVTHSEIRRLNLETIEQDIHNTKVMIINNTLFCSMIVPDCANWGEMQLIELRLYYFSEVC